MDKPKFEVVTNSGNTIYLGYDEVTAKSFYKESVRLSKLKRNSNDLFNIVRGKSIALFKESKMIEEYISPIQPKFEIL